MSRSKDTSPISIQIDKAELARRTKRGTANFLSAIARIVDPNFDRQDIRSLTPQERERSLQLSQRVAEAHLSHITTLSVEFGLLGGRTAAKTNPQAARLLQVIEQKEKILAEIKFDGQPVVTEDQIYRVETTCQRAADGLRQASTGAMLNAIGVDNAIGLILQGKSPDKIVAPYESILQQALQMIAEEQQSQK